MYYTKNDIVKALENLGIKTGDIIFSHMNLGLFGIPKRGLTEENLFNTFFEAIFEVIGEEGLLIVPTFTYSIGNGEIFDVDNTPSKMGLFAERLRKKEGSIRTLDPMLSVCLYGNKRKLWKNGNVIISTESYGKGSIWDFMYKNDAVICNFNLDAASTFIHYIEKKYSVPYRFNKTFEGYVAIKGKKFSYRLVYFARDKRFIPDFEKFSKAAYTSGLAKRENVARGSITAISCKNIEKVFLDLFKIDKYALCKEIKG